MSEIDINYLAWDSDFFGKKIGSIFVEGTDRIVNILDKAKNLGFQLIYVFSKIDKFINDDILKKYNGNLVDCKVVYIKNIQAINDPILNIFEYKNDELLPELEGLAYSSGEYSRFKVDKNFKKNDFYRMYKIWMEKSIKHKIADIVFVVKEDDKIKGMITLKNNGENGSIGLIAVLPEVQGKGYGKSLIKACEIELLGKDISVLEVATQLNNIQACKFYEKLGFQVKEKINIYHFWLVNP